MRQIRSFKKGGVRLRRNAESGFAEIPNAFIPNHALVLLRERADAPEPSIVVTGGQEVREGQLLARQGGGGSVNVHAPIPGLIRKIVNVDTAANYRTRAIVISLHGAFNITGRQTERYLWRTLNAHDILYLIQDKGVVRSSSGEAVHGLLQRKRSATTLLVNALETDAYSCCEAAIIEHYPETVLNACAILHKAGSLRRVVFALPAFIQPELQQRLATLAADHQLQAEFAFFGPTYPQHYPNQLADALGQPRRSADTLCMEPSTLLAIDNAVVENKAHISQFVYLGGGALKRSMIVKARIGTPIGKLIEECGGFSGTPDLIALNNPFTSGVVRDLDLPVSRTTRSVLALTRQETRPGPERPCIRCGNCLRVCPEGLNPSHLHRLIMAGRLAEAEAGLARCTGCGACSFACYSRIPLSVCFQHNRKEGSPSC